MGLLNTLNKSLEELENNYWPDMEEYPSGLVKKVYELRKVKLSALQPGDIRLMLVQNTSLALLVPLALDILEREILIDATYYEGDLLFAAVRIKEEYWLTYPEDAMALAALIGKSHKEINECEYLQEANDGELKALHKINQFLVKNGKV